MTNDLMKMNTEDFNTMRSMLSEIEMKIIQLDPLKQRQFGNYIPVGTRHLKIVDYYKITPFQGFSLSFR